MRDGARALVVCAETLTPFFFSSSTSPLFPYGFQEGPGGSYCGGFGIKVIV
jgi:hypothetical protein